ncbi:hypothetical protein AB4114_06565 [Paenibacillus sp. 2RAB27]|uniref:hypothetical protein n=1 Tax=Paenibacillus sp. 2RAB27 TaxID=3232991 RepID=UPI003F997D29
MKYNYRVEVLKIGGDKSFVFRLPDELRVVEIFMNSDIQSKYMSKKFKDFVIYELLLAPNCSDTASGLFLCFLRSIANTEIDTTNSPIQNGIDLVSCFPVTFIPAQGANILISLARGGTKDALIRMGLLAATKKKKKCTATQTYAQSQ